MLGGCTTNALKETDTICIKECIVESIGINDFMDNIEYVAFRDYDSVLIGEPQKVLLCDDVIFVSDQKGVYQISKDGHCIGSLEKYGRGPGEYLGILDFIVEQKHIYLLDNNRKILKYTISGEFMSSAILDFFPASLYFMDSSLIVTSACQSDVDKFHILDIESFAEKYSFQEINEHELSWRHIRGQSNFYAYGGAVLFHEPMNDVIYSIDSQELTPVVRIDLYGRNAPQSFWSGEFNSVYDINVTAVKERYCFGTPVYAESGRNIVFTYRDAEKYLFCHYTKKTKDSRQSEQLAFRDLNVSCNVADLVFGLYDESDQIVVLPGSALQEDIKGEKLSVPGSYDGPVFCVARMK